MKIYFEVERRDPEVKSETFWSHDSSAKEEYVTFFLQKNEVLTLSDLKSCDFAFIPYKWKPDSQFLNSNIYQSCVTNNRTVVSFFNDDYDGELQIPENNFLLFRTSTYRHTIKKNEIIMPAFCETFDYIPPSTDSINHKKISFCGNPYEPTRINFFKDILSIPTLNKNFIFRRGFWAPEIQDKSIARKQFIDNLRDGLFGICIRGNGNFSYRLYETLALGRIPIIINSSLKLPLEKFVDWKKHSILIESNQINDLNHIMDRFIETNNIDLICRQNKLLYDDYFSPLGLIKHFHLYVKECD